MERVYSYNPGAHTGHQDCGQIKDTDSIITGTGFRIYRQSPNREGSIEG